MLNSADLRAPEKSRRFSGFSTPESCSPTPKTPRRVRGPPIYPLVGRNRQKRTSIECREEEGGPASGSAGLSSRHPGSACHSASPTCGSSASASRAPERLGEVIRPWDSCLGPGTLQHFEKFRSAQSSMPRMALALPDRGPPYPGLGTSARPRWSEPRERMVLADPFRGGEGPPSPRSAQVGRDFDFFCFLGFSTPGTAPARPGRPTEPPARPGDPRGPPPPCRPLLGDPWELQAGNYKLATPRSLPGTAPARPGRPTQPPAGPGDPRGPPPPGAPCWGTPGNCRPPELRRSAPAGPS